MQRTWLGAQPLMVGVLGGRLTFQEELGLPFAKEVAASLGDLGIENVTTTVVENRYPRLPRFEPDVPPVASLGLEDLIIGFGMYVAGALSDATAGRLVDHVYEACVQPALDNLKAKMRTLVNRPRTTRVLLDHWFDGSGVLVRMDFHVADGDEYPSGAIVRTVLLEAVRWITRNPTTHRVLTFEVKGGHVSLPPKLSEPI